MRFYITALYFAIPAFIVLISMEALIAKRKGLEINKAEDMLSSLSSGITNVIRDGVKFGVVIISYSWLVDRFTIIKLEPLWLAVIIAFIIEDFAGYWMHRMNHRVNVFWNRHIIHHSSEEFNLSCALRQSISDTLRFSAIFTFPAAILGIPPSVFAILTPLHLFMQFWYHTQVIDKMGFLEYFIVTPSHHRVHHAINPEYIDKNYSQIFIIWDKLFGTFQPELDNVKPVYGTLKQVNTWNPILINFKHIWQLTKDAWHTQNWFDKLRIWFMPTGWRPDDVKTQYPLSVITDVSQQKKYKTSNSTHAIIWSWIQLLLSSLMMFHFFSILPDSNITLSYLYALMLIVHVFSFSATLDRHFFALMAEGVKILIAVSLLYIQNYSWFGLTNPYLYFLIVYLIISFFITAYLHRQNKAILSTKRT